MKHALACLLLLSGTLAHASPPGVWRCGNTYADAPCEGGRRVAMADTQVSPADAAQARRLAADWRREADAMERERLVRESRPMPLAVSIGPVRPPVDPAKATKAPQKKKAKGKGSGAGGREGDFTIDLPRPPKDGATTARRGR